MATGFQAAVLRPAGGRALVVAVAAVCCVPLAGAVVAGDAVGLLRAAAVVALIVASAVAVFWLPAVAVDPAGVEIRNVLRTTRIPWPAVTDVETRWSLVVVTGTGRVTAWAAPRSTAVTEGRLLRRAIRAARVGGDPAAAVRDLAPSTAAVVLRQWQDSGGAGADGGSAVTVRWHRRTIVVLAALLVLAAVAV